MLPNREVVQTLSEEALADGIARACRGDAQAWACLNGDDTESADAFERLTHALGLDADVLRAGVLQAMRMGTPNLRAKRLQKGGLDECLYP